MKLRNTNDSYGLVSKLFHWFMALFIIGMVSVGFIMTKLQVLEIKMQFYKVHKAVGVTLLFLAALRLIWKLINLSPNPPVSTSYWQMMASKVTTVLLYGMMLLMPISGILMSLLNGHSIDYFGAFIINPLVLQPSLGGQISYQIHIYSSYALVILLALHIIAAFYHHVVLRDNILRRILINIKD